MKLGSILRRGYGGMALWAGLVCLTLLWPGIRAQAATSAARLYRISGEVDSFGDPVSGITITRTGPGVSTNQVSVRTDENGNYTLPPAPPGQYVVRASFPTATILRPTRMVTLQDRDVADLGFTIVGTLTGRVTDTTGHGLAGIKLKISDGNTVISGQTNAQGYYALRLLPVSAYDLEAAGGGYTFHQFEPPFHPLVIPDENNQWTLKNVSFVGFRAPYVSGFATDGAGGPLPTATIFCAALHGPLRQTVTARDGFYVFDHLPPSTYGLGASLPGWVFSFTTCAVSATAQLNNVNLFGSSLEVTQSGDLSQASASATRGSVTLRFKAGLNSAAAQNRDNYTIFTDGSQLPVLSASYNAATHSATLNLPPGALTANRYVTIQWHNLADGQGHLLHGGVTLLTTP